MEKMVLELDRADAQIIYAIECKLMKFLQS